MPGGTYAAALIALDRGFAANSAGGSHHALADTGAGYCVFNDLAIAAIRLIEERTVQRILIVDCDVHQGDGTAALTAGRPGIATYSIHADKNFPVRKGRSTLDVPLPDGTYVAVRPELKLTFTVNGSGLSTTDDVACTTGGDRTGDLGDVYVTEKMDFPTCAAEPNAFECDTGDGYMRIRDDQLGNFTISSTSTPTIDFKFDVGTGVLFTANGGACTFKSMGFLDATLTLSN